MSSNYYLFFSNNCEHSKKIVHMLNCSSMTTKMNMCCIDDLNLQIPQFITTVPSLYIKSQQPQLLQNQQLFDWVISQTTQKKQQQQTNNNKNDESGIMAYHREEFGGNFSDNYSFISDNDKTTKPLSHAFEFLGDSSNYVPPSQNLNGGGNSSSNNKRNEKADLMNKAYEDLVAQRNSEMNNGRPQQIY